MVLNCLNFCFYEKLLISPSVLKEILAGYSNLGCRFSPLSTLNISCYSLLACRVSAERSAVKCTGFPLYVISCFSLPGFIIISLCSVFVSFISMCLEFILYGTGVYPVWDSWCLLDLIGYFLLHVGEIFNYNFSKNFRITFLFPSSSGIL